MSICPRWPVADCPECGGSPDYQMRGFVRVRCRLVCKCGVSGAWRPYDCDRGLGDPWHSAADGWPFKLKRSAPPPKPR